MSAEAGAPTKPARARRDFELVLVGGGLQNGLIALAALRRNRGSRIALVEAGPTLGGNHTWSIHPQYAAETVRPWLDPLFAHCWSSYEVRFPGLARTLETSYAAITSARFAEVLGNAFSRSSGSALLLGRRALRIEAGHVELDDGTRLDGELVVDARGPDCDRAEGSSGFQKFVGLELQLEAAHGLTRPILMDATVPQDDGYRFFYVLPFGPDRILVEDTRFSHRRSLDVPLLRAAVLDYAARFGRVADVVREEVGVLPMPWSSRSRPPRGSPLVAGYRGGWFHPATGYSMPAALRLACHVSTRPAADVFDADLARLYAGHRTQVRFAHALNLMLFRCFEPELMWNVFARFYRLPEELIHRFYAMSMTRVDRTRMIIGRPPRGFSLATALSSRRTG